MATATTEVEARPRFVRKEREHLDVIQKRLDFLRQDDPSRRGREGFLPGEANALAWALSVITEGLEPIEIRVERLERNLRVFGARLGNVERGLREDLDEDDL